MVLLMHTDTDEAVTLHFPGFPPIQGVGPAIVAIDAIDEEDA
jgi:hypothetical protein